MSKSFLINHINNNSGKYILGAFFFVLGVCVGVAAYLNLSQETRQSLVSYFAGYSNISDDIPFAGVLKSCMQTNLKYIILYFLLSLTLYTSWACVLMPGVRGFSSGFAAAFLMGTEGGRGTAYTFLSIIPSVILSLPVYVFAAVVCINFAAERRKNGEVGARTAVRIIPALAIIYFVMAICGLFDVFITPVVFKLLF